MRKKLLVTSYCLLVTLLTGCATSTYMPAAPQPGIPGVYHRVERGETLWRISRMYDIDLDEIVRVNRISDAANIEVGQLILIPRRQKQAAAYGSFNDFAWPLKGRVIAGFGATKGLNIQTTINDDISAARAGKVVFYAEEFQGYGKTVIIDHGDGFMTVYAGLGRVQVNPGQSVEKGAVIATGQREGLLHFEIRKGPLAQNPYFYLTR